jgi:hypothetical protein
MINPAEVFAAIENIEDGYWDRFLPQIRTAIARRLATAEYRAYINETDPPIYAQVKRELGEKPPVKRQRTRKKAANA